MLHAKIHNDLLVHIISEAAPEDLPTFRQVCKTAYGMERHVWDTATHTATRAALRHIDAHNRCPLEAHRLGELNAAAAALQQRRRFATAARQGPLQPTTLALHAAWRGVYADTESESAPVRAAALAVLAGITPLAVQQDAELVCLENPYAQAIDNALEDPNAGVRLAGVEAVTTIANYRHMPISASWRFGLINACGNGAPPLRVACTAAWAPILCTRGPVSPVDLVQLYDRSLDPDPDVAAVGNAGFSSVIQALSDLDFTALVDGILERAAGKSATPRLSELDVGILAQCALRAKGEMFEAIFVAVSCDAALAGLALYHQGWSRGTKEHAAVALLRQSAYTLEQLHATIEQLLERQQSAGGREGGNSHVRSPLERASALAYLEAWAPELQGDHALRVFNLVLETFAFEHNFLGFKFDALVTLMNKVPQTEALRAWRVLLEQPCDRWHPGYIRALACIASNNDDRRVWSKQERLLFKAKMERQLSSVTADAEHRHNFSETTAALQSFLGSALVAQHVARNAALRLGAARAHHHLFFHPGSNARWAQLVSPLVPDKRDLQTLMACGMERARETLSTSSTQGTEWRDRDLLDALPALVNSDAFSELFYDAWFFAQAAASVRPHRTDGEPFDAPVKRADTAQAGLDCLRLMTPHVSADTFSKLYDNAPTVVRLCMLDAAPDATFADHAGAGATLARAQRHDAFAAVRSLANRVIARAAALLPPIEGAQLLF